MKFATAIIFGASDALAAKSIITVQDKGNYMAYLAKHGKNYKSIAEFETRLTNWKVADEFIKSYPSSSFTMSHNKFSDYSEIEKSRLRGRKHPQSSNTSLPINHRL